MRNIFITRRKDHLVEETGEIQYVIDDLGRKFPIESPVSNAKIEITDSLEEYHYIMKHNNELGLDTENNSLNQFYAIPLLIQFAIPGISIIIDQTSVKEDFLSPYTEKTYIGHNLQYDYRIIKYHNKVELRKLIDCMINEQIINRGSGRFNNLEDAYLRRCGKPLPEDKTTRNDFIHMTEKSRFKTNHIIYAGFDPQACLEILPHQNEILKTYKLEFRAYGIGMPLIPILGDMNLNGFTLNRDKWKQILEENKRERFNLELKLDEEIKKFSKDNVKLRGGIWTRKRRKEEGEQTNLFFEGTTIANDSKANVSYGSQKQLTRLFNVLKEPLPQKKNKKTHEYGTSFAEEALEQYKIQYPASRTKNFINYLLQYREVEKEINSFGEKFLKEFVKEGKQGKKYGRGYYQPKTNKVHTIYKQEFTANGRLSSGEGKKKKGDMGTGFYNSQQWPKKNKFRNCATLTPEEIEDGWWITTLDLEQAELVIGASFSKDKKLIEIIKEGKDLHSYLCTNAYTEIIKYIIDNMPENRAYDELYNLLKVNRLQKALKKKISEDKYVDYTKEEEDAITKERVKLALEQRGIIVNKKDHPDIRDPFKNVVYGVNYGASEQKIAETLNLAIYYAKLILEGMKKALPQLFAYLDKISKFGVKNGFLVFNNRTNSRHWFKAWLDAKQYGKEMSFGDRSAIERACKNYGISGSQADMIKEAMVEIDKHLRSIGATFEWLLQVHDEIVIKHKDKDLKDVIAKVLVDTCNKYLEDIEMKVAGYTGHYWNK